MHGQHSGARKLVRERRQRRAMVEMLHAQGMPPDKIAETLQVAGYKGCSKHTIRSDVSTLEKKWLVEANQSRSLAKAEALAMLKNVMSQAWKGWADSRKDEEVVTEKTYQGEDGPIVERTVRLRGQAGDARFLSEVRSCIGMYMDLYGLTDELAETAKQYGAGVFRELMRLAEEQLEQPKALIIDSQVIEAHVLGQSEPGGNGKPHNKEGEDNGDGQAEA